jgi:hypothetical protein
VSLKTILSFGSVYRRCVRHQRIKLIEGRQNSTYHPLQSSSLGWSSLFSDGFCFNILFHQINGQSEIIEMGTLRIATSFIWARIFKLSQKFVDEHKRQLPRIAPWSLQSHRPQLPFGFGKQHDATVSSQRRRELIFLVRGIVSYQNHLKWANGMISFRIAQLNNLPHPFPLVPSQKGGTAILWSFLFSEHSNLSAQSRPPIHATATFRRDR